MAEATQEMIALAREMFAKHKGWGNNAPFWDDLRKGLDSGVFDRESELRIALAAIQATTERTAALNARQSGEGERLRDALELAKIKLRRYMDVHGPNGLNPDTYVGGYQAEIEAVLTTIAAALRATDDAGGA